MISRAFYFVRPYTTRADLSRLRNIGIIAHIDAGKTTTTERMLYYSGKINRIGDVDQGDTITDFLPQERSRGITIQSAAISFNWQKKYKINLIDTPGHADFTFEVIRSVKVLDGCVTILDAVAGVEAQTEKVWKQSENIPKICFINKMDRDGAGYSRTVKELITKMQTKVALINLPFFEYDPDTQTNTFKGIIDLVNQKILKWDAEDPDRVEVMEALESSGEHLENFLKGREALVEILGEFDENLVEYFLEEAGGDYLRVPADILNRSIRRATLAQYLTPVFCGASFRNIGVQPLLDAVVNYLPSPLEARFPEVNHRNMPMQYDPAVGVLMNHNKNLCVAFAFKVITDSIRGTMIFVRVYSGVLNSNNTVYNCSRDKKFKLGKLALLHANVYEETQKLYPGEIGVLTGATVADKVSTGDTIVTHSVKRDALKSLNKNIELNLKINPITVPPPVFVVCVEPKTLGNKRAMEEALSILIKEDPSLVVSKDEETGQTLLGGMGELHLEIARDRLLNDLNAEVHIGKVMVSYKESINSPTADVTTQNETGCRFSLSVAPIPLDIPIAETIASSSNNLKWYPLGGDNNYLIVENHESYRLDDWSFQVPYSAIINAIVSSSIAALQKGGKIANFPLHSCAVKLKGDWRIPLDLENVTDILPLTRHLISQALHSLRINDYSVLEPVMNLEVNVPQKHLGSVVQDLTAARKSHILSIDDEHELEESRGGLTSIDYHRMAQRQYLPPDITLKNAQLGEVGSGNKIIRAIVPLKEMVAYTNTIRSLTQGRGTFYLSYHGMDKVGQDRLESVIND
ncbi:MEF2 (YJL102W) [Zygosaccharomyces parabailii]|nr:MEF2 (YJL102W) [Zygosaccharomyces parabailii]